MVFERRGDAIKTILRDRRSLGSPMETLALRKVAIDLIPLAVLGQGFFADGFSLAGGGPC